MPPPSPAAAEGSAYGGKVLFITQRGGDFSTNVQQPTFVWDPIGAPDVVETPHVLVPNDSTTDIFCSGVTFLGNGTALTVGGRDRFNDNGMFGDPTGTSQSFILRTDLATVPGSLSWQALTSQSLVRYYPTALKRNDGSAMAFGHAGHPNDDDTPLPLEWGAARYRETFVPGLPGTGTWAQALRNLDTALFPPCVDDISALPLSLGDYPKIHMLTSHELMHVDGEFREMAEEYIASYFLSIDDALPEECPGSTDPYRWRMGVPIDTLVQGEPIPPWQAGGNSVHLITREDSAQFQVHEVVYAIAGTDHGEDDEDCPNVPAAASNRVFWMEDPDDLTPWSGAGETTDPWNLNLPRVNCNTVILLDGSLLVVGGADTDPSSGACIYRQKPERFRPPQVFEGATQPTWNKMAPQIGLRRYHSVAGLLPDGSVFSAGGSEFDHRHSAEVFKPPYFFRGPRPKIVGHDSSVDHGQLDHIQVSLRGGGPGAVIRRVAVLRNAAVTHAFDSNQRYVELEMGVPVPIAGTPEYLVPITYPTDPYEAPPGWYLLTVVADMDTGAVPSSDQLPSRAEWVYIDG